MTTPIQAKAVLADDEPLLVNALARELGRLWPELAIVGRAGNGDETLQQIAQQQPDVVFLDIHMPAPSGLEVAQRLARQSQPPLVVFVTAYDEFALEAFEIAAADYLTKPVNGERLARTVERLQSRLQGRALSANANTAQSDVGLPTSELALLMQKLAPLLGQSLPTEVTFSSVHAGQAQNGVNGQGSVAPLKWLKAAVGNSVRLIAIDDVLYFEAADKYVNVVTADNEVLIRTPLKELLPQLDANQFWQIHRSTVINMAQAEGAVRDVLGRLTVKLKNSDKSLKVSRAYAHLFRHM
ncbi:LytR/AlgR family response regulator transcription factor [Ampullimonas aquatilis]|uniref:LytR/AlgR family response regulator transcription factor n=1 Tax=Ampullimonas aquatilis TaxID=1341549 RepID=UPI003C795C15